MTSPKDNQSALIFRTFLLYGALIGFANIAISLTEKTTPTELANINIFQLGVFLVLLVLVVMAFLNKPRSARWAQALNARVLHPTAFWLILSSSVVLTLIASTLLIAIPYTESSPHHETWLVWLEAVRLAMLFGLLGTAYLLIQAYALKRFNVLLAEINYTALAASIMLIGVGVRGLHLLFIDVSLPYTSGGLFLEFSRQISASGYRLPEIIPFYSQGGIPYAYPPVAFMLQALVIDTTSIDPIVVGNIFPVLVSLLTLPLFYRLTREWDFSQRVRLSMLFVYAVLPSAYKQLVESQGTAEAFGTLALLLFAIFLKRAWQIPNWRNLILVALTWALAVCVAPGSIYFSILLFLMFSVLYLRRSRESSMVPALIRLVLVSASALLLSLPYWGVVVSNHGFGIFFNAFSEQHQGGMLGAIFRNLTNLALSFQPSSAPMPFYWNLLIFFGIWVAAKRRYWDLLACLVLANIIPRESDWLIPLPGAIFGGMGLAMFVTPEIHRWVQRFKVQGRMGIFVLLTFFGLRYVAQNNLLDITVRLTEYDRAHWESRLKAYQWARQELPPDAQALVLTHEFSYEWAPYLMERTVLNVFQGLEWQPEENTVVQNLLDELPACYTWPCITDLVAQDFELKEYYIMLDTHDYPFLPRNPSELESQFQLEWQGEGILWLRVSAQELTYP